MLASAEASWDLKTTMMIQRQMWMAPEEYEYLYKNDDKALVAQVRQIAYEGPHDATYDWTLGK